MKLCFSFLTFFHFFTAEHRLEKIDRELKRAFSDEATHADFVKALILLPQMRDLLVSVKDPRVLEWVELDEREPAATENLGILYPSLQALKKYILNRRELEKNKNNSRSGSDTL